MKKIIYRGYIIFGIIFISGCVTSPEIKDASTKHSVNLVNLEQAVKNYRKRINSHFKKIVSIQRDAYIADKIRLEIDEIEKKQSASLKIIKSSLNSKGEDVAAQDFIKSGLYIQEQLIFYGNNFDKWLKFPGNGFNEKKSKLKNRIDKKSSEINSLKVKAPLTEEEKRKLKSLQDIRPLLEKEFNRSDDDLTYIIVACNLELQKQHIDRELQLLEQQIIVMKAFHNTVDEFLSIDATIDAGKIAEAAAAGSQADISGLVDLRTALEAQ